MRLHNLLLTEHIQLLENATKSAARENRCCLVPADDSGGKEALLLKQICMVEVQKSQGRHSMFLVRKSHFDHIISEVGRFLHIPSVPAHKHDL